jgi:hypothetical protein
MSSEFATLQPLHTPEGNVYAYVVPVGELDRLRAELDAARAQAEGHWRKMCALLPKATPEEEAEMRHLMETAVPGGLDHLIAQLEAEGYPDGHR